MRLLIGMVLVVSAAWAQPERSNGEASPAVRQQQKQADYARKQHPSSKSKQERASLRTKDTKGKPASSKPGEAAIRTPK
jgi:hypothetical protein